MSGGSLLDTLYVHGGTPLQGEVAVSGTKNGSLALLASALLVPEETIIDHLPDVADVGTMVEIMRALGAECEFLGPRTLRIDASELTTCDAPEEPVRRMRASFYVAGPLLARYGFARVPRPGGCVIGSRPIDYHLAGFRALGAEVLVEHGFIVARASRLLGGQTYLDPRYRSVGATVNVMMAAVLADGTTVIENASRDPDVVQCARFLNACGAKITGIGGAAMRVTGVDRLHGVRFSAAPDRMEAGTFLLAAAATQGDVTVRGARATDMQMLLDALRQAGCETDIRRNAIRLKAPRRPRPFDVVTAPFPGFPTDLHPPTVVLQALAAGRSLMEETIFEARFNYADELSRMGARIQIKGNTAITSGVPKLSGAPVVATDLRAGAALALAALAADGETEISGAEHLDRGYENFVAKLRELGADVVRAPERGAQLTYVHSR